MQKTAQKFRDLAADRQDALDRLILSDTGQLASGGDVLLLEDATGSLTLTLLAQLLEQDDDARLFVRQRSFAAARQTAQLLDEYPELTGRLLVSGFSSAGTLDSTTLALGDFLQAHGFQGDTALGRLPKSHAALADWAQALAAQRQGQKAWLLLGGNTKHMSPTFNETLATSFDDVRGLRGKGKHRCLLAENPRLMPANQAAPSSADKKQLQAFGGVFGGSKADKGGQLLAQGAGKVLEGKNLTLLDFGCGNGSVSRELLAKPALSERIEKIIATDIDADAVRSARVNLPSDKVEVTWDQDASRLASESVDYVLLNPPFHEGTSVDLTLVQPLLEAAWRVLKPGGKLFLVHNSHARYCPQVDARFASTQQLARDKTFTLLSASKK